MLNFSRNRTIGMIMWLSVFTFIVGLILMVFMIVEEQEPGALPLFLVFCGLSGMVADQMRLRKKDKNVKN